MWSELLGAERPLGKSTGKGRKSGREMERGRLLSQGCVQGVCRGSLQTERRGLEEEGVFCHMGCARGVQGGVFVLRDVIRKKRKSLPSHGVCKGESSG